MNKNRDFVNDVVVNGVSLKSKFSYNGVSYWWFINDALIMGEVPDSWFSKQTKMILSIISSRFHLIITLYDLIMKSLYYTLGAEVYYPRCYCRRGEGMMSYDH